VTDPTSQGSLTPPLRGGSLDTLRPMAAVASGIMVAFIVCALVWWLIRAGRVREVQAHGVATGMIALISSNILLSMWLLKDPFQATYICVLLVGAGAGMTSIRWGVAAVVLLLLTTAPVLVGVADTALAGKYMTMVTATSVVAIALIVLRARNLREFARLTALDHQQRRALNDALADLDAKVSLRTAELQAANAALTTEIDERARAEQEARLLGEQLLHAQRLESLGRLAGGVAHDFNNLLTVIHGNLQLSLDELPDGAGREPIEDAISASERAARLTKQLLAFGRKQVIERSVFDAGRQVEDVARMLQRVLGERIELHVSVLERDLWVNADPNQIEQVLMNLAANARDAMPDGGVCRVEVGHTHVADALFVRIRVADTGVGMDAATRERLFEPFFTTKGPGEGTGLGLATAYGVLQQHGGSIVVDSHPGVGTTFDLLLPAADAASRAAPGTSAHVPSAGGTETVLLVEDEDAVRRVAERFLRRQGYQVLVASSGTEALALVRESDRRLDLLFTDVMMPGMSGFELAERVRLLQPQIKVMFVSGYTGDYLETQAGELPSGALFVYKPYDAKHTARLIREILDKRAVDSVDAV
jgi:two-component system, cell cycle sensor histidine kinase and response regulator CckA